MSSKLLFIYEQDMPTVSSIREEFLHLTENGIVNAEFLELKRVDCTDIEKNDVIIFIRPNDILTPIIAKHAKHAGKFIIVFCDDDLLNKVPEAPWRVKGLRKLFYYTDVMWSSSKYICGKYQEYIPSKRIAVTDTVVRPEQIYKPSTKDKITDRKVKIVYAANIAHVSQFETYILPIMPRIVQEFSDKVSLTFIGVKPELTKYESKIEIHYKEVMPLEEYRSYMESQNFDIGIAPLCETEFTKCKYANKYIEYSLSGVMGIYSKIIPYIYAVKDYKTGILAENTKEGWFHAIKFAIENIEFRRRCVILAQEDLRKNYSEEKILEKLWKEVPELKQYQYKKAEKSCKSFILAKGLYYFSRLFDWLYLSSYYWKIGGFQGFYNKLKTHIKGKSAYAR